ncbi:hypothetical protein ACSQ67_025639 [Phaseolus vulgaris]
MDNSSRFVGLPPDLASNQNQIYRDPLLPPVTVQKQLLRLLTLHAFGSSSTSSWDSCPCLTLILLWRMWWSWTFSVCNFSKNRGHVEAKYQIKAREQSGAIALIQLQEDMKKQLSSEGDYTEEELEEYMQSHKKLMIDSLWKLNVADIEATLSRVCQMVLQDNSVKKEELRARAKGLKTLGKIFQRVKSANGNDNESVPNKAVHKLNGSETSNDACSPSTSPKSSSPEFSSDASFASQSPYVEAPHFAGMQFDYNFPRPTAPPGAQRPTTTSKD